MPSFQIQLWQTKLNKIYFSGIVFFNLFHILEGTYSYENKTTFFLKK